MKPHLTLLAAALALGVAWTTPAAAHCDTLDGPVAQAAHEALASGRVEHALIWVRKADEPAIRNAFAKARKAGGATDTAAERSFQATLVRVHRAGEGESFTGLKPAGAIAPAVVAADEALRSGSPEALEHLLVERVRAGLRQRYEAAVARREFAVDDVAAGRAYVGAYVAFVHHVERVSEAATPADAHDHAPQAGQAAAHRH